MNENMKKNRNSAIYRARMLRRKHERQRKTLRLVSAMLIVMTIATFTLSIRSFASESDMNAPIYKYYTSYTVKEGENLNMLAGKYMTEEYRSTANYISEVVSINHLVSASDIYAGQTVILPYYSSEKK